MTRIASRQISPGGNVTVQNNEIDIVSSKILDFAGDGVNVTEDPTGTAKIEVLGIQYFEESQPTSAESVLTAKGAAANIKTTITGKGSKGVDLYGGGNTNSNGVVIGAGATANNNSIALGQSAISQQWGMAIGYGAISPIYGFSHGYLARASFLGQYLHGNGANDSINGFNRLQYHFKNSIAAGSNNILYFNGSTGYEFDTNLIVGSSAAFLIEINFVLSTFATAAPISSGDTITIKKIIAASQTIGTLTIINQTETYNQASGGMTTAALNVTVSGKILRLSFDAPTGYAGNIQMYAAASLNFVGCGT